MEGAEHDGAELGRPLDWPLETTLLALGWVLVAIAPLVVGGGDPTFYLEGPVLPVILVALALVGYHLRAPKPWTYLAAGLGVSLLPVMILAMFGTSQLTNPLLATEFPANVLLVTALLLALPAGILGFLRARREAGHPRLAEALRDPHGALAALLVGAAIGAIWAGALASSGVAGIQAGASYDVEPDRTIEVVMRDELFVPDTITLQAGELTEIVVVNEDDVFHTFTYERNGTTYNHDVYGSETITFLTMFETTGDIHLWCEPHQPHMVGTIQVE